MRTGSKTFNVSVIEASVHLEVWQEGREEVHQVHLPDGETVQTQRLN